MWMYTQFYFSRALVGVTHLLSVLVIFYYLNADGAPDILPGYSCDGMLCSHSLTSPEGLRIGDCCCCSLCLTYELMIDWSQVTAGFCTTDILRHLSSEEVSRVPQGASSDRMTRLASHLLAQRRYIQAFLAGYCCRPCVWMVGIARHKKVYSR